MTILWPGAHLDYHFKAEKCALRDKFIGSSTGMKNSIRNTPKSIGLRKDSRQRRAKMQCEKPLISTVVSL